MKEYIDAVTCEAHRKRVRLLIIVTRDDRLLHQLNNLLKHGDRIINTNNAMRRNVIYVKAKY